MPGQRPSEGRERWSEKGGFRGVATTRKRGYWGAHRRARGCSSDGRALQSHCRGQGFDSPQLHQPPFQNTQSASLPRGGHFIPTLPRLASDYISERVAETISPVQAERNSRDISRPQNIAGAFVGCRKAIRGRRRPRVTYRGRAFSQIPGVRVAHPIGLAGSPAGSASPA